MSASVRAATAAQPNYAPSGQRMPLYKKGWRRVFAEDFRQPVARGAFPGTVYGASWRVYPDGWKDTTKLGTYAPSQVLSVHGGLLDYYLHSSGGQHLVAAALPLSEVGSYGRYAVRFRADRRMHGYKTAWLLWPDSKKWPEGGEIDWPEGNLDGTSFTAFNHFARPAGGQAGFNAPGRYQRWHTAVTEWRPGQVDFFLDGKRIGRSRKWVPREPMHWVLQTETSTDGSIPADSTRGHLYVDWAVAWRRAKDPVGPRAVSPTPITPPPAARDTTPDPSRSSPRGTTGDIVLAAVGDASPPSSTTSSNTGRVAASIRRAAPRAVAFLGDFQYEHGTCSTLVRSFDAAGWGALMPKMIATAGPTHDWAALGDTSAYARHLAGTCPGQTSGKSLADRATGRRLGPGSSYEVDLGTWRVYSVSSGLWRYSPARAARVTRWLAGALARGKAAGDHPLVIWHEPYWTSSTQEHTADTALRPWIQVLDSYDVPLLLSGHQHGYERFAPQDAGGTLDAATGTQQFVVGTGGIGFYPWESTAQNSLTRESRTFGWLRLVLHPDGSYDWRFVRTGGARYYDSGRR
ncbi:family 16 glycosylhydrolase [Nocardioides panacis]|uniref:Family 16 glycosylhydrolase n=1 Tax=Nocardioides panacis TaxID=2849501 RepID=A0A975XZ78_9ACTN|nr:family 16 glycosylhydrolase [Nocardioides panacis]QWZ06994.1 family 16 glycosylhydrolase [Nocardioides panacis]